MYFDAAEPRLAVGSGWTDLTLQSEVGVIFTSRGYAPAIRVVRGVVPHLLIVGAKSLAEPLEALRRQRGKLPGAQVRLRKVRPEVSAPYEVLVVDE